MPENDPLSTLKFLAASYGIPPEVPDNILGALGNMIDANVNRARAAEIAALLTAAQAATAIGQTEMADALIEEAREIMGLSGGEDESAATGGDGTPA